MLEAMPSTFLPPPARRSWWVSRPPCGPRTPEPAFDQLILNTLAGLDQPIVGAGVAALIAVTVNA